MAKRVTSESNLFKPRPLQSGTKQQDYFKSANGQVTPEAWDAIVARAVHDAVIGKLQQRAKAREWLAKHVLPIQAIKGAEGESRKEYDLLVRIYRLFEKKGANAHEMENALAVTLGALLPEERAMLRAVLDVADSDEVKEVWDEMRRTYASRSSGDLP
jgi:hypothetical protein